MMDIEYTGRQTVIGKKLKTQSEAGLARIAKLVGRTASAHVFLTTDKYRRIAEVTLKTRGHSMVATCEAEEHEAALHDALAKLEKQAIKHKQKKTTEKRHPKTAVKDAELESVPGMAEKAVLKKSSAKVAEGKAAAAKIGAGANGTGESGRVRKAVPMVVHSFPSRSPLIEPHIVRSLDSAAMRPMSLEEAVKEAAFRDKDVFVFRDRDAQVMVLHRRRDGKMELIVIP